MNRLAGPVRLDQGGEERELLLEQVVVVLERVAEQRERLGERAAAEDHLGAAVGDGVEGGEALVDADGVVGAEDGDGGAELDPRGPGGDGGQDDFGGADGEVGAVVLADAEEVDAELVGQLGFGEDVAEDLGLGQRAAVGGKRHVAEGVEAHLGGRHGCLTSKPARGFPLANRHASPPGWARGRRPTWCACGCSARCRAESGRGWRRQGPGAIAACATWRLVERGWPRIGLGTPVGGDDGGPGSW